MSNGQRHRFALPPGYALHWYEIESVLGQGGFGITYLARDTNLNHRVAIKEFLPTDLAARTHDSTVVPVSNGQDDTYGWGLKRFITEAQTLVKFRHPNIVQVHTVFEANNTAYMVMEHVQGQTLEDALKFGKLEGEDELKRIIFALLDGLELIHEAGFIHRDIKPDNIFLRDDGTPVLLDFGSARQAIGAHTRTLTALVSPGYAPLEQYDGSKDGESKQGPWTDIYALGATLYRAVTGQGPPDAMHRVNAMVDGKDVYMSAVEAGKGRYSETFLRAIDRALAFHTDQRPQSIASWRADLKGVGSAEAATEIAAPGAGALNRLLSPAAAPAAGASARASGTVRSAARMSAGGVAAVVSVAVALLVGGVYLGLPRAAQQVLEAAASDPAPVPPPAETVLSAEEEARIRAEQARREAEILEKKLEEQQQLAKEQAKRLAELEAAREREERIAELLAQAAQDLAAGRLTKPTDGSAFYRLSQVIALDGENTRAKEGLKQVVAGLVERARGAIEREAYPEAAGYVAEAEAVLPGAEPVATAREALERAKSATDDGQRLLTEAGKQAAKVDALREAERRQAEAAAESKAETEKSEAERQAEIARLEAEKAARIQKLLAKAEANFKVLRLTSPPGNNALERYREVLALNPGNAAAEGGILEIGEMYLTLKDRALAKDNFDKAAGFVEKAAEVMPGSELVNLARDEVEAARREYALSKAKREAEAAEAAARRESEQLAKAKAELERLRAEQKKVDSEIEKAAAASKLQVVIVPFWGTSQDSLYVDRHDPWLEQVVRNAVSGDSKLEIVFSTYGKKPPPDNVDMDLERVWPPSGAKRVPDEEALERIGKALSADAVVALRYRLTGENAEHMTALDAFVFDVSTGKLYSSSDGVGLVNSGSRIEKAGTVIRTALAEFQSAH